MQKRHFQQFADSIACDMRYVAAVSPDDKDYAHAQQVRQSAEYAAHKFADLARQYNPRFDRDRFFRACGVAL